MPIVGAVSTRHLPVLLLAALAAAAPAAAAAPRLAVTQVRCATPCSTGITTLASDGGARRVLTRRTGWEDGDPAWSPDGRRLAFTRSKDGRRSFEVLVRSATGRLRRITRGRFDERPAWSADGRWIAYQATTGIRLVRPDGSGDRGVPGTQGAAWPAWAPGGRIAFTQGGYVRTARTDGTGRRRVVRGREPDWSRDGSRLAYTGPDGGVFVASGDGRGARMVHRGMQPDWSPDGSALAFTRWGAGNRFSVWTMEADGSAARRLLADARDADWQP